MFRFRVRSKTAAARLGKARWLGNALAEGWLEAIEVAWSDGALARLTGLRELHLDRCLGVTGAGLAPLRQLPGLRRLKLWGCQGIAESAVVELRQALPALQVERL